MKTSDQLLLRCIPPAALKAYGGLRYTAELGAGSWNLKLITSNENRSSTRKPETIRYAWHDFTNCQANHQSLTVKPDFYE